jgi:hypothetical protein
MINVSKVMSARNFSCIGMLLLQCSVNPEMFTRIGRNIARPFRHFILTKDRHSVSDARVIVLFRAGQNHKHLHHAHKAFKGKVYARVLGADSTCDTGVNAATVSQDEVDGEMLD